MVKKLALNASAVLIKKNCEIDSLGKEKSLNVPIEYIYLICDILFNTEQTFS